MVNRQSVLPCWGIIASSLFVSWRAETFDPPAKHEAGQFDMCISRCHRQFLRYDIRVPPKYRIYQPTLSRATPAAVDLAWNFAVIDTCCPGPIRLKEMSRGHVSETDFIQSGAILGYLEMSTMINYSGYYSLLKAMSPAQFQLIVFLPNYRNA